MTSRKNQQKTCLLLNICLPHSLIFVWFKILLSCWHRCWDSFAGCVQCKSVLNRHYHYSVSPNLISVMGGNKLICTAECRECTVQNSWESFLICAAGVINFTFAKMKTALARRCVNKCPFQLFLRNWKCVKRKNKPDHVTQIFCWADFIMIWGNAVPPFSALSAQSL